MKCVECGNNINTKELEENEIISCSACGTEYVYRNGNLEILVYEGEDFGE